MKQLSLRAWLVAGACLTSLCAFGQVSGPPDRMTITHVMERSSMHLVDRNNDGAVSDVDVSWIVLDRLILIYGPDLSVGDVDQNGVVNGEDMVAAIAKILRASFGKSVTDAAPIGVQDVEVAVAGVANQNPTADLNSDGAENVFDVLVPLTNLGAEVDHEQVGQAAREAFNYIGAMRTLGTDYFMSFGGAAAQSTHMEALSQLSPASHPSWWHPNHQVAMSLSYEPWEPNHLTEASFLNPPPNGHRSEVSDQWPTNHFKSASSTWPAPPSHGTVASVFNAPDPGPHTTAVSGLWPSGHTYDISGGWGPRHDVTISRTWWPRHTVADSLSHIWPPLHAESVSGIWNHGQALSQVQWPPNHVPYLSDTWGPGHSIGVSAEYPPGHVYYASTSWPGPQPGWPAGHTKVISIQWGEPEPDLWPPVFPPNHSWFTTFKDLRTITPRIPWPTNGGNNN